MSGNMSSSEKKSEKQERRICKATANSKKGKGSKQFADLGLWCIGSNEELLDKQLRTTVKRKADMKNVGPCPKMRPASRPRRPLPELRTEKQCEVSWTIRQTYQGYECVNCGYRTTNLDVILKRKCIGYMAQAESEKANWRPPKRGKIVTGTTEQSGSMDTTHTKQWYWMISELEI